MLKFLLDPSHPARWRAGSQPHRIARVETPCPRRAVSEAPLTDAQRAALAASSALACAPVEAPARRFQGWVVP